ncbi:uncharacterized mitochondrial protein AtMg00810-like [Malus domestica]|uniref:uncharacterized mitochondrial protein AtMg00810-like n=1 Tax=Malus domestica TaxID=3750 RepID=UPI003975A064
MDVMSAFLNRVLEEEVYIQQPSSYEIKGNEDKVLKLKKALYGLKQAPRAWNNRIDKYFQENNFTKCPHEHALHIKVKDGDILIVCLYVDDLIFTGSNPRMFEEFMRVMTKEFEMTDIGLMAYYIGIEVKYNEEGIFISQESYTKEILKKFKMENCKPISTPMECGVKLTKHDEGESVDPTFFKSLGGSLRYLTCTKPDILYAVGLVSRYMENPTTTHLKTAKRILRYLKGDSDDRKSTTRFVFFMGDTAFIWMSKKQPIVTLSTCEPEYRVVYQLHKVGKFDEILTKIDRRSGKEIEKETKFLKNGDAVMIVAIGVIKSVKKKDPSGAEVTKSAAKKK